MNVETLITHLSSAPSPGSDTTVSPSRAAARPTSSSSFSAVLSRETATADERPAATKKSTSATRAATRKIDPHTQTTSSAAVANVVAATTPTLAPAAVRAPSVLGSPAAASPSSPMSTASFGTGQPVTTAMVLAAFGALSQGLGVTFESTSSPSTTAVSAGETGRLAVRTSTTSGPVVERAEGATAIADERPGAAAQVTAAVVKTASASTTTADVNAPASTDSRTVPASSRLMPVPTVAQRRVTEAAGATKLASATRSTPSASTGGAMARPIRNVGAGRSAAVISSIASLRVPASGSSTARVLDVEAETAPAPAAPTLRAVSEVSAPAASVPEPHDAFDTLDLSQLSGEISRATQSGDGSYSVSLALHPADLGRLEAVVSMSGTSLTVSLSAQSVAGHAALTGALDALKSELGRDGATVNVTLNDGAFTGGEERRAPSQTPSQTASNDVDDANAVEVAPSPISGAAQLHLVL